jgi:hypothetical protein
VSLNTIVRQTAVIQFFYMPAPPGTQCRLLPPHNSRPR